MNKELNIAAILKDKPEDTKLWSPAFGEVLFTCVNNTEKDSRISIVVRHNGYTEEGFFCDGRFDKDGECLLFPSKDMQDWSKFSWKKGDVLKYGTDRFCIFDTWSNDDYTKFEARCITPTYISANVKTNMYIKANDTEKAEFIKELEKYWGVKLNLDTLRVEKPQFKTMDWCLMRRGSIDAWHLCQYSDACDDGYYAVGGNFFKECAPYNEKTEHLLGTTDDWKGGEGWK